MHNARAFDFDVSASPAISVIRRGKQGPIVVASAGREAEQADPFALARKLDAVRADVQNQPALPGLQAARIESWFAGSDLAMHFT